VTTQFTATEVIAAVIRANELPFPLVEDEQTGQIMADAIYPALQELPPHHCCEVVEAALKTMFVMGIASGLELARGS
jgi:hypothetical protein